VAADAITWPEVLDEFERIQATTEAAFNAAVNEPKITSRVALEQTNSAKEVTGNKPDSSTWSYSNNRDAKPSLGGGTAAAQAPEVMRKLMTQLFDDALGGATPAGKHAVYLGEDVRHGG
jgi:hypothetical protein